MDRATAIRKVVDLDSKVYLAALCLPLRPDEYRRIGLEIEKVIRQSKSPTAAQWARELAAELSDAMEATHDDAAKLMT